MSEYAQVPRHNPKAAKSLEGSFYGHTQVETSALCQLLTSFMVGYKLQIIISILLSFKMTTANIIV